MFVEAHIKKRLSFATGYLNWSINPDNQPYSRENWNLVIWSDETSIALDSVCGTVWVQRPVGAAYDDEYIWKGKERHPEKVHVWGCFSAHGVGDIEIFEENMNAKVLEKIFEERLVSSHQRLFPTGEWWFQQDNDPKHHANIITKWLHEHGIQHIDWPPYSPDLNPIENLWQILKNKVYARRPRNVEQLKRYIREEWKLIPTYVLRRLVQSMHKRCLAVIKRKGGITKY